ncbi:hypothetical protein FHS18_006080 [Paenibacillus phyllosphaerae]|uniref:DNA mimic protein DMP19 C-terminal domain-containing protein n=1 Tax=Paenibacillus phyllosphaerae TaxID=274593 RepID=A0A7W5B4F4_9BACL|nr:DUF4375 domain-containing protein [Paenibacillus phyllosphaerae]MBB3113964.1 hypothetical protein [Paenibacillus phyllosphaerae]
MENIGELVRGLLPKDDLSTLSSEAIVEHIAMNMHKNELVKLRDRETFVQLPVVLQDILLLLDFDIELQMNGIVGFLENSTGFYLEETIQALNRIRATKDFEIMTGIKRLLDSKGVTPMHLKENVNQLSLYQVTNVAVTHGDDLSEVLVEIDAYAENLYLYRDSDNIFDLLFIYLQENKIHLYSYAK